MSGFLIFYLIGVVIAFLDLCYCLFETDFTFLDIVVNLILATFSWILVIWHILWYFDVKN